ncbi:MAG: DUF6288 domain-containing protein, partial [Phycisphaerae bacterium]|nr:DUF6288 domain-containing protein [Phycisphaerae bacterium]
MRNTMIIACLWVIGLAPCLQAETAPAKKPAPSAPAKAALPKTHADAAARSLAFLARVQKPDGRWETLSNEPPSLEAYHGKMTMVLTSASGLAMLAHGDDETSGTYRKQIAKAKDYLLGLISKDGKFTLPKYADGLIKTHIANEVPFMVFFLNEIYSRSKDAELKTALQKVADYISAGQHPRGGWDYTYKNTRHRHTATAIQNLAALALLKRSGIRVKDKTINDALAFIKDRHPKPTEKPGYMYYGDGAKKTPLEPGVTNRAAGLLVAMHLLDKKNDPLRSAALTYHKAAMSHKYIYGGHSPAYQHFMVATASNQLGRKSWSTYIRTFGRTHLNTQNTDGQ